MKNVINLLDFSEKQGIGLEKGKSPVTDENIATAVRAALDRLGS